MSNAIKWYHQNDLILNLNPGIKNDAAGRNPMGSKKSKRRCRLLRAVPTKYTSFLSEDWEKLAAI